MFAVLRPCGENTPQLKHAAKALLPMWQTTGSSVQATVSSSQKETKHSWIAPARQHELSGLTQGMFPRQPDPDKHLIGWIQQAFSKLFSHLEFCFLLLLVGRGARE